MEKKTGKQRAGEFVAAIVQAAYGIDTEWIEGRIEIPAKTELGDYAFPCFELSGRLKKSPRLIAEELKQKQQELEQKQQQELTAEPWLERVEAIGGYLNLYCNRDWIISRIMEEIQDEGYGTSEIGKGKTICMDYSSPNIAKSFHVGHLRTTIIGNSLARIYTRLGYRVVRINHLGDWGTQFGKLITAYRRWSSPDQMEAGGIDELSRIYVKFDRETELCPELNDEARDWFARMEQGDKEALAIWRWFKEISIKEYERVYELLGVTFDSYNGESFYISQIPALINELKEKKLLKESEGAWVISLEQYDMPPCMIVKKDGSSIYHSRDIAAAIYRKKTYDFSQCLYITGMEQKLHFAQVFQALKLMGYDWADHCRHIPYGLVSMGGLKLSTRKGNIVYAEEILREAIARAAEAIENKNPGLKNREETARQIGIGAVIFHDLCNQLIRDVKFCWEEVLNFDGMTAPYIQYTHARACSILRKGSYEEEGSDSCLNDDASYELIVYLGRYPEAIAEAAEKYEPCIIARYVYGLAVRFNQFYQKNRIADAKPKYRAARLRLTDGVRRVIADGMGLLGIECPNEM